MMLPRTFLLFVCALMANAAMTEVRSMNANAEDRGVEDQRIGPKIDRIKVIDLSTFGRGSWVKKLTFSPDGQYLAIVDNPNISTSTITPTQASQLEPIIAANWH